MLFYLLIASLILWVILLCLPWQPWQTREQWDVLPQEITGSDLSDITVLIPARNESEVIEETLLSTLQQGRGLNVIIIDDNSEDDTARIAKKIGGPDLTVLEGSERPDGWSGKLWALEQGRKYVKTPLLMLLDADIKLKPGVIAGLKSRLEREHFSMISLMVRPSLNSFWEILLMPAFIYFFKLLYPFRLANSESNMIAAAAGGCIIMETEILEDIGGFRPIKDALIDDCMLARQIKNHGYRTWLGLTNSAESIRPYHGISELWNMVARTAYNQLYYSPILLLVCTVIMIIAFWLPILGMMLHSQTGVLISLSALLLMYISYLPTLLFYNRNFFEVLVLPLTAALYLAMTWTSAFRYWQGERMRWRGRTVTKAENL